MVLHRAKNATAWNLKSDPRRPLSFQRKQKSARTSVLVDVFVRILVVILLEERADRVLLHVRVRNCAARLHDNHQLTGKPLDPIPSGREDLVPLEPNHSCARLVLSGCKATGRMTPAHLPCGIHANLGILRQNEVLALARFYVRRTPLPA